MVKVKIEHHVLDIPERLKEIDPDLKVLYDTNKDIFELWGVDKNQSPYFMASFTELDNRILTNVRRAYFFARNTKGPYQHLLHEQEEEESREDARRLQREDDIYHGMREDLNFMGKEVGIGCSFQN